MPEFEKKFSAEVKKQKLDKHFVTAMLLPQAAAQMLLSDLDLGDQEMIDESIFEFKKACAGIIPHYEEYIGAELAAGKITERPRADETLIRRVNSAIDLANAQAARLAEKELITREDLRTFLQTLKLIEVEF